MCAQGLSRLLRVLHIFLHDRGPLQQDLPCFTYHKVQSGRELTAALEKLYKEQILPLKKAGLQACIYTQLSDVETERNGLLTWDRKVLKPEAGKLLALNEALKAQGRDAGSADAEGEKGRE